MTDPSVYQADANTFYDAATWSDLPHDADLALYCDGLFKAARNAAVILRAREVRQITVTGDYRAASIVDYERLNPVYFPAGLRGFVRGRRTRDQDAIVYCNEVTAAEAISALRDFGQGELLAYPKLYWWIATLDNVQFSAAELVALLAGKYQAPEITEANLWANQWGQGPGQQYDISNRFLPWHP